MAEPIVFITTLDIHEGKLEEAKAAMRRSIAFFESSGPQLMMGVYLDEGAMVANGVQVHRDSGSILSAWQMGDSYMREVLQHVSTRRVEVFGQPDEAVMEGMRRLSGMGAEVVVRPRLAGFDRFPAATRTQA